MLDQQPVLPWIAIAISAAALLLSLFSFRHARQSAEAQSVSKLIEEYASPQMHEALRTLRTFYNEISPHFDLREYRYADTNHAQILQTAIARRADIDRINDARRIVHWYFKKIYRLHRISSLSTKAVSILTDANGYALLFDVVWPLSRTHQLAQIGKVEDRHFAWFSWLLEKYPTNDQAIVIQAPSATGRQTAMWNSLLEQIERASLFRLFRLLGPVGVIVAIVLFAFQICEWNRARVLNAWTVIANSSATDGGNVGQLGAVEYLNDHGISLAQVRLPHALLRDARLRGAMLERADLRGAVMERANLQDANLWRANLQLAFLSYANLKGAILEGAFLQGAQMEGADLTGANLSQTDLTGTNLTGAKVKPEQLAKACGDPERPPKVDPSLLPPTPWPSLCRPWVQ